MTLDGKLAAVLVATAIAAPISVSAQAIEPQSFGLYVLADDVDRSSAFYEALFGRTP